MADTLLTISMITNEAQYVLRNSLGFTRRVNRSYDDKFGIEGAKIGDTLNVRRPPRYIGRNGPALSVEDSTESSVPVKLDTQFGVDINFSSKDLLLNISDFSKKFIVPAVATIANKIDYDGLQLYRSVADYVGTMGGGAPNALLTYLNAGVALSDNSAPVDEQRHMVINPLMQATIVNALTGLLNPSKEVSAQYIKGTMADAAGWKWAMDQNCPSHTVGAIGVAAATVTNANQIGSLIVTGGWTANATLLRGEIVTFAGCRKVNLQNRADVGVLRQFTVTADCQATGGGVLNIPVYPALIPNGAGQTVTVSPGAGALISVHGLAAASFNTIASNTYREGMGFHKDAFCLASADLPLPNGVDMAARSVDPDLGISIRLIRDYDINTDKFPCRLDVLYGWAALRPELACRVGC